MLFLDMMANIRISLDKQKIFRLSLEAFIFFTKYSLQ